ncbi:MAG: class I SAM-dependent methyltransferase [Candidatus Binatia bacterium]
METYRRKIAYQDKAVVEEYLGKFIDPVGRREHEATALALTLALERIPGVKRILDLPCGAGRFTHFFHQKGYLYFGADVSMTMMEVLHREQKRQGKTTPLVRCDGEHLPFKDSVFDCVVSIRFLNHHIPAIVRERIVGEMRRVSSKWLIVQSHRLKPVGPFIFLKILMRKLCGGDVSKYLIRREILSEGWKEKERIPIQDKRFYIGVYQKT